VTRGARLSELRERQSGRAPRAPRGQWQGEGAWLCESKALASEGVGGRGRGGWRTGACALGGGWRRGRGAGAVGVCCCH